MNLIYKSTRRTRHINPLSALVMVGVLMGTCAAAIAHDANIATIKITRHPSNNWIFELHTPLHGLDVAMREFNQDRSDEVADLSKDSVQYKEMIIDYVKSGFDLEQSVSDDIAPAAPDTSLGRGRIKLGEHASVLMFEIQHMSEEPDEVTLHFAYMENNPGQANVIWLLDGERTQHYVLSASNEFTVSNIDFFANSNSTTSE